MKSTVLWNATPSSAAEVQQCLGGIYCLYLQDRTIAKQVTTKKEGARNISLVCCLHLYPKDDYNVILRNVGLPSNHISDISTLRSHRWGNLQSGREIWRGTSIPPTYCYRSTRLHGDTSYKTVVSIESWEPQISHKPPQKAAGWTRLSRRIRGAGNCRVPRTQLGREPTHFSLNGRKVKKVKPSL
jgi:hypothetical protein